MSTLPSESAPQPAREVHEHRGMAESFGVDPERYDRTRPSYPVALIQRIVGAIPGRSLLNVGCGTGIEARQFQSAGCTVLGVEPDARMAEFARRTGVEVEVATIEAWEPAGRTFDAVVAGTAWHWVDPVAGAAKAARVLRPGGRLAPFWHVQRLPAEMVDVFSAIFRRLVPNVPINFDGMKRGLDAYQLLLDKAANGMRAVGAFGEPEQWRFDWAHTYTRDEWLEQVPTMGALTRLPQDALAEVLDGIGAAVDAMGGTFTLPYATVAVTAVRAGRT